jgi:hypothetical protein
VQVELQTCGPREVLRIETATVTVHFDACSTRVVVVVERGMALCCCEPASKSRSRGKELRRRRICAVIQRAAAEIEAALKKVRFADAFQR